jgi:hypothetical protein
MVLLAGDIPSTGICRDIAAGRIDLGPSNSEVMDAFLDLVEHGLRHSGAVVVLYPSWRSEGGPERLIRLARGALLTDRIAALPLDLPPLALSLIADQLAFVAPHVDPGTLASLGRALRQEVYAGAWVNSVARLENVPAGLSAHLSSYLPGQGFSVCAAPVPEVHRISSSQPVQAIGRLPADPVLVLASQSGGDAGWLGRSLQPAVRGTSIMFTGEQPLGAAYWGTKKYLEFVAFSAHAQALHTALSRLPRQRCSWCGAASVVETCLFCGMTPEREESAHVPAAVPVEVQVVPPAPAPPLAPAPMVPQVPPVAQGPNGGWTASPGPADEPDDLDVSPPTVRDRINGHVVPLDGPASAPRAEKEVVPLTAPVPPPPQPEPLDTDAAQPWWTDDRRSRERDPTPDSPANPPQPSAPANERPTPPTTRPAYDRAPEVSFAPRTPSTPELPGRRHSADPEDVPGDAEQGRTGTVPFRDQRNG